jgi:hypothetical protein
MRRQPSLCQIVLLIVRPLRSGTAKAAVQDALSFAAVLPCCDACQPARLALRIAVMSDPVLPMLPYASPMPIASNFGIRAAKLSWLAPLAGILFCAMAWPLQSYPVLLCGVLGGGALSLIAGLAISIAALVSIRRYGRKGILVPALIGFALNAGIIVLSVFFAVALLNGLAGDVR